MLCPRVTEKQGLLVELRNAGESSRTSQQEHSWNLGKKDHRRIDMIVRLWIGLEKKRNSVESRAGPHTFLLHLLCLSPCSFIHSSLHSIAQQCFYWASTTCQIPIGAGDTIMLGTLTATVFLVASRTEYIKNRAFQLLVFLPGFMFSVRLHLI